MLLEPDNWTNAQKVKFLAVLAHELTVCARGTYEKGTARVLEPESLRAYNEVEHRVTGALRDYVRQAAGMPLSVVMQMLHDFGCRHDRKNDVEFAISRAQKSLTDI